MENAAHTLSGLVLARLLAPGRRGAAPPAPDSQRPGLPNPDLQGSNLGGAWPTALLVTAANFPDIDCVSALIDLPTYLDWHHGITHSVLGVIVSGPLLGLLFFAIAKQRGQAVQLATFIGLAYLGIVMHCALDAMLNYGMRPWLPFDATWYYGDVIFVADPWVWALFGAGAILGGPRSGGGLLSWALFATATVVVCLLAYHAERIPVRAAWGLAPFWGLILGLRARGIGAGRRRYFAGGALVAMALYVTFLLGMGRGNLTRGIAAIAGSPEFVSAGNAILSTSCTPVPGVPWQHRVLVETADSVFGCAVDGMTGYIEFAAPRANHLADPRLRAHAGDAIYQTWRRFARHPVATWRGAGWTLGDARYPEGWCDLRIETK